MSNLEFFSRISELFTYVGVILTEITRSQGTYLITVKGMNCHFDSKINIFVFLKDELWKFISNCRKIRKMWNLRLFHVFFMLYLTVKFILQFGPSIDQYWLICQQRSKQCISMHSTALLMLGMHDSAEYWLGTVLGATREGQMHWYRSGCVENRFQGY